MVEFDAKKLQYPGRQSCERRTLLSSEKDVNPCVSDYTKHVPPALLVVQRVVEPHPESEESQAESIELGFNVTNQERFRQQMSAKGIQFNMPPTRQDFGGILAQFLDSEGGRCSVAEQTSKVASQYWQALFRFSRLP